MSSNNVAKQRALAFQCKTLVDVIDKAIYSKGGNLFLRRDSRIYYTPCRYCKKFGIKLDKIRESGRICTVEDRIEVHLYSNAIAIPKLDFYLKCPHWRDNEKQQVNNVLKAAQAATSLCISFSGSE